MIKRADSGYSLVEMLATLLVLSSVFLLILSGVGTTRRVWERSDARSGSVDSVIATQNTLRMRLEQAFPQTRFDRSAPYVDFKGELDHLSFLSPASDYQGRQALRHYDLQLTSQGELVLASTSDVAAGSSSQPAVLLEDVSGLTISYFGDAPGSGAAGWQPVWQSRSRLPGLVRILVEFPPGDTRVWPELIVRPAATTDSQCVLDVGTGKCRGRA